MSMRSPLMVLALGLLPLVSHAASPVLIRNATVHTLGSPAVLEHTDLLIANGKIAELGPNLSAPAGADIIDAAGRPVTPGMFGGLGHLGIEEITAEPSINDYSLKLSSMRPEFDVTPAFNPDSVTLGVNRLGGITFAVVMPSTGSVIPGTEAAGTIIAGQGAVAQLDGTIEPKTHALFVDVGVDASPLSGGSRAAQWMLLQQALTEVRSPRELLSNDQRLLTPAGRRALREFTQGAGPVVFDVDRASDIRQVIALASREKLRVIIKGGVEAWRVAPELAAARIPVVLNPLDDLPETFDGLGATPENAARLHRAGVKMAFSLDGLHSHAHIMLSVRQAAGVAVAHGVPWETALAAITKNPAEVFGVADHHGSIARGRPADLVLWSGDPLDVTTVAERVFIDGRAQPMQSRQTLLRDRYLKKLRAHEAR